MKFCLVVFPRYSINKLFQLMLIPVINLSILPAITCYNLLMYSVLSTTVLKTVYLLTCEIVLLLLLLSPSSSRRRRRTWCVWSHWHVSVLIKATFVGVLSDLYLMPTLLHSCVNFIFPLFVPVHIHKKLADNFSRFNFGSKVTIRSRPQERLTTLHYANR
jgi:hypothetical protein